MHIPLNEYTDAHIISDLIALEHLFALKRVIRYNQTRETTDPSESVAEHVFGMHLLAEYFLPLEDNENHYNRALISTMITLHDIDEIVTGDTLGYLKTAAIREAEAEAMRQVIAEMPHHMQHHANEAVTAYEIQTSWEARFVKAIDKLEPLIHLYNDNGKRTLHKNQTTKAQSLSIKTPFVAGFPFMERFLRVTHAQFEAEDYFLR